ncbi:histone-lysine N-methyltransferase SETMAR [Trichonephila clavipes]|nr:histone-lysine N-methyltransferase SETMAR [Trichonephila clavipes]
MYTLYFPSYLQKPSDRSFACGARRAVVPTRRATCHTARAIIELFKDTFGDRLIAGFEPVNRPPRSCDLTPLDYFLPDLTPNDFHLFLHLKSFLAGEHFNNDKELKENVSNWLKTQVATFYEEGIEKLVPRYDTGLQNFGTYVER